MGFEAWFQKHVPEKWRWPFWIFVWFLGIVFGVLALSFLDGYEAKIVGVLGSALFEFLYDVLVIVFSAFALFGGFFLFFGPMLGVLTYVCSRFSFGRKVLKKFNEAYKENVK